MLRDITIGQFYPAQSVIHRLDPRVKLFATVLYMVALFTYKGIVGFGVITLFLFGAIALSKVPVSYIVKGLRAVVVLILMTSFFNVLFTPGLHVIWKFGIFQITDAGISNAILMAVRFIYLIIGTSLMTLTTTPTRLTDGLEKALSPLARIKIPVHAIALMMSIALRFIPILMEETDKIMKAQMARGADFETGNIFHRIKNMVPILVPLFVSAFRRADDLALAMEARCYTGGEGRTKLKPLRYTKNDAIAYVISIAFFAAVILLRIFLPLGSGLIEAMMR